MIEAVHKNKYKSIKKAEGNLKTLTQCWPVQCYSVFVFGAFPPSFFLLLIHNSVNYQLNRRFEHQFCTQHIGPTCRIKHGFCFEEILPHRIKTMATAYDRQVNLFDMTILFFVHQIIQGEKAFLAKCHKTEPTIPYDINWLCLSRMHTMHSQNSPELKIHRKACELIHDHGNHVGNLSHIQSTGSLQNARWIIKWNFAKV